MTFEEFLSELGAVAERCSQDDPVEVEFQDGDQVKRVALFGVYRAGLTLRLSATECVSDPRGGPSESESSSA